MDFFDRSEDSAEEGLIPTRESLLSRLQETSTGESWREFFETYWKLIYNFARKAGLNNSEAQEVVQETMLALTRSIKEFRYDPERCSFKTYLLNLTRWKIADQVRRLQKEEALLNSYRNAQGELEADWEKDWQLNLADEALRRVQRRAPPRMVQAFTTCVLQGRGGRETAKLLRMSVPAVYLNIFKIRRLIKLEAIKIEKGEV